MEHAGFAWQFLMWVASEISLRRLDASMSQALKDSGVHIVASTILGRRVCLRHHEAISAQMQTDSFVAAA